MSSHCIRAGPWPAPKSARPRACHRFVGANSDTGFGGEETKPIRSRRNASARAIAAARLANARLPIERGTDNRDENLERTSITGWTLSGATRNRDFRDLALIPKRPS